MKTRKRLSSAIALLLTLLMALSLVGCGEQPSDGGTVKDSLVVGINAEPASLDPSVLANMIQYEVAYQIFDTLLQLDSDGKIVPALAETWDYSEDMTEVTFHLRDGVKFHNGDPLTADDVVYTFDTVQASSYGSKITAMMDHMEKIDDLTCKLILKYPFAPIEQCVASANLGIMNKNAHSSDPEAFGRAPVGTGAYKVTGWNSGESIVLESNPEYWKGEAAIKSLTFRFLPEATTAAMALQGGEVDVLQGPDKTQYETLKANSELVVYETTSSSLVFIALNNESGVFSNKLVRQALSHAVNVDDIILGIVDGNGRPVNGPFPADCFGYPADSEIEKPKYDPELSKQLLAEAGYPDGLTFTVTATAGDRLDTAVILQTQLKEAGFNVVVKTVEYSAQQQDAIKRQYEMMIFSMMTIYTDADTIYSWYHSDFLTAGTNYQGINSPELDALLEQGRMSADPAERQEIYKKICQLWTEECFNVPLYTDMSLIAADKDIQGLKANSKNLFMVWDLSWAV